jgi:dual specificity MAP kinase phosphatase
MAGRGPASLHLDFNKKNDKETSDESDAKTAPVEILPFLYLGNESHCASREVLEKLGVTAVMNVSKTINNHFQGSFLYKNVPVDDSYNADISRWFRVAVDFIGE